MLDWQGMFRLWYGMGRQAVYYRIEEAFGGTNTYYQFPG
jgi:hypothetical protein